MNFNIIVITFMVYSVLGWVAEVIYCSIGNKKLQNRGFAFGPLCPIYGAGGLFIIYFLQGFKMNPFIIFSFGLVGATVIEYMTSVAMEKLFGFRWWDYSKKKFHINGRVCLVNSFLFGVMALLVIYIVHPFVSRYLMMLTNTQQFILAITFLIAYGVDLILSIISVLHFKKIYLQIQETERKTMELLRQKIKNTYSRFPTNYVFHHFTTSFPNMKLK